MKIHFPRISRLLLLASFCLICLPARSKPQSGPDAIPAQAQTAKDYSKEPYIVERIVNRTEFDNDGTFRGRIEIRIRVQSAAGVQSVGLIQLPYASATSDAGITNVTVTKPGGAVVRTPAENAQDTPAQITVAAPFYSDLKVKELAVRGLDVGDTLEYQETIHLHSPVVPGQFWYTHDFLSDSVVLDEEVEVSVPQGRGVKVKSPRVVPDVTVAAGRRVYTWKSASRETTTEREQAKKEKTTNPPSADAPFADVQLSSFQNWDEVGQWYRQLQESRVVPTPEIRAKAAELTRGATSDDAKIRALYAYVATKFRYIAVNFGTGRYQPHAAAEVLSNGYGDCKDKHTLLAALLAAVNVKAYPALVNGTAKIDADVPSPGQFNHVVTVVPKGSDLLWLDTTPEVAPFGMLTEQIRDTQALVMGVGPALLVKTPVDPSFKQAAEVHLIGKIGSNGTLDAKVETNLRGDAELFFRESFHRISQAQWSQVVELMSAAFGYAGTVSDSVVSSPEALDEPLHVSYRYSRKDYPNWPDVLKPPVPVFNVNQLPEDNEKRLDPIKLGSPMEELMDSRLELPEDVTPKARPTVEIKKDFAEYNATYSIEGKVVHVERRLKILMREIPRARSAEYAAFQRAVGEDEESLIVLFWSGSTKPVEGAGAPSVESIADLGDILFRQKDLDSAINEYRKALVVEPNNARVHETLGDALSTKKDFTGAEAEYRAAIQAKPDYPEAHLGLGEMFYGERNYDAAIPELREAQRLMPKASRPHVSLGNALAVKDDYGSAEIEFRDALRIDPKDGEAHRGLGDALYRSGRDLDGAVAEFREAVRIAPEDESFRDGLAEVLLVRRDFDAAAAEYRRALAIRADDAEAHSGLGDALFVGKHDLDGAAAEYREALRLGPGDARAHAGLGNVLLVKRQYPEAMEEAKAALMASQRNWRAHAVLGELYMLQRRNDEGLGGLKTAQKLLPFPDAVIARNIGLILILQKRNTEAAEELEPFVKSNSNDSVLNLVFGQASLRTGSAENTQKGLAAMRRATETDASTAMLIRVVNELAEDNVGLDDALDYSKRAVEQAENQTLTIDLQALKPSDASSAVQLAAVWDTMGWVQLRLGHFGEAEKYLIAAWKIAQIPAAADRLGQVYEKIGDTAKAIQFYALSVATGRAPQDASARLTAVAGNQSAGDEILRKAANELRESRTIQMPRLANGQASADFFVLLTAAGHVKDARFIKGSEELRGAAKALTEAEYDFAFPGTRPVSLARRGVVSCPATGANCRLELLLVTAVNSIN